MHLTTYIENKLYTHLYAVLYTVRVLEYILRIESCSSKKYSRVSLAVEHPIICCKSFFDGNIVVCARVQMHQVDHVS